MIEGKDIVACVAIPTCGLLVYLGQNGAIMGLLCTIIGWYFGSKQNEQKTDNNSNS